jgi:preprotein translocase SecE subunit
MKVTQFLQETRGELKQVSWSSRRRIVIYTVVVIIFSLVVGYVLGAFDALFETGLRALINN